VAGGWARWPSCPLLLYKGLIVISDVLDLWTIKFVNLDLKIPTFISGIELRLEIKLRKIILS
jgi:hypothetical protein